jgi:hypothetical protein
MSYDYLVVLVFNVSNTTGTASFQAAQQPCAMRRRHRFSAPALMCCAAVVDGEIKSVNLEDYKGNYVILFFYPKDFT